MITKVYKHLTHLINLIYLFLGLPTISKSS